MMSVTDVSLTMSAADIKYDLDVGRWEPDSRGRLERAALDLYVEKGFENTTVAEIAERAGVTERTFFRHFSDKREVLFAGSSVVKDLLIDAVMGAPDSASPMEAVCAGLQAVGAVIQQRGELAKRRQLVIAANEELRERELIKMASWSSAVAGALCRRGAPDSTAALTAEAGIAAFRVAFEHWVQQPTKRDLSRTIRDSFDQLREVTAGASKPS